MNSAIMLLLIDSNNFIRRNVHSKSQNYNFLNFYVEKRKCKFGIKLIAIKLKENSNESLKNKEKIIKKNN